jgi:hypothetical protein
VSKEQPHKLFKSAFKLQPCSRPWDGRRWHRVRHRRRKCAGNRPIPSKTLCFLSQPTKPRSTAIHVCVCVLLTLAKMLRIVHRNRINRTFSIQAEKGLLYRLAPGSSTCRGSRHRSRPVNTMSNITGDPLDRSCATVVREKSVPGGCATRGRTQRSRGGGRHYHSR